MLKRHWGWVCLASRSQTDCDTTYKGAGSIAKRCCRPSLFWLSFRPRLFSDAAATGGAITDVVSSRRGTPPPRDAGVPAAGNARNRFVPEQSCFVDFGVMRGSVASIVPLAPRSAAAQSLPASSLQPGAPPAPPAAPPEPLS